VGPLAPPIGRRRPARAEAVRRWLLVGLLLAGCGSPHWSKSGATAADFSRDSYDCASRHQEVQRSFAPYQGYREGVNVSKELYRACMTARGYQRVQGGEWEGPRD
jgi:hypothetical protein